jgi:ATP/maltotriose-dependent transcriptional regulator MalT
VYRGDWDAAAIHVETGISLGEDLGHFSFLGYARAVAAFLAAARGDDSSAAAHAAVAQDAARASPSPEVLAYAALARAHCAWARADWPAVIEALTPVRAGACGTASRHPNLAMWRCRLAEAYLAQGQVAKAQRLLGQVPAGPWGGITAADRARLQALAWQRAGQTDRAAATFASAMPSADSRRLADGLLALDYGRLLAQLKRRKAAAAALLTGRSILAGLGAIGLAGSCDRALLAAGGRPASREAGPPDPAPREALPLAGLTAREQAVARLAASGLTNREVAAEMYVSVKAVEYHLSHVFAKLGIQSRRQLPATLAGSRSG